MIYERIYAVMVLLDQIMARRCPLWDMYEVINIIVACVFIDNMQTCAMKDKYQL